MLGVSLSTIDMVDVLLLEYGNVLVGPTDARSFKVSVDSTAESSIAVNSIVVVVCPPSKLTCWLERLTSFEEALSET